MSEKTQTLQKLTLTVLTIILTKGVHLKMKARLKSFFKKVQLHKVRILKNKMFQSLL